MSFNLKQKNKTPSHIVLGFLFKFKSEFTDYLLNALVFVIKRNYFYY